MTSIEDEHDHQILTKAAERRQQIARGVSPGNRGSTHILSPGRGDRHAAMGIFFVDVAHLSPLRGLANYLSLCSWGSRPRLQPVAPSELSSGKPAIPRFPG